MKYRLPKLKDKEIIKKYIKEHYSCNIQKLNGSTKLLAMNFEEWVKMINDNANIGDDEWGKSLTYLVFNDEDELVGLLNIRYDLTNEKAMEFGHIGYGVRPSQRRKGYATKMLQFALNECKKYGLEKVIVACYKENKGSANVILKNNGKLIKENNVLIEINDYWEINLIDQIYEIKT